ncbi:MAG: hypothetical protein ACREE9_14690, partial [Stellaceae bacterium]
FWVEATNTACWAYDPDATLPRSMRVTWGGACSGHLISGPGTLNWYTPPSNTTKHQAKEEDPPNKLHETDRGTFVSGVLQGPGMLTFYDTGFYRPLWEGSVTIIGIFTSGHLGKLRTVLLTDVKKSHFKKYIYQPSSNPGAGAVVMHWIRSDQTDTLSGVVTPEAMAGVDDGTGETIQASATCDDGFANDLHGADEDIEFSTFQGSSPLPILWNNQNKTTVEYKIDNQDADTTTTSENDYTNVVTVGVGYDVMSTSRIFYEELTLSNGAKPIFDINPADPVLRAFTDVCEQKYQSDHPSSKTK